MEYTDQIGFHVKRGAAKSNIPAYSTTSNMVMYLTKSNIPAYSTTSNMVMYLTKSNIPAYSTTSNMAMYLTNILCNIFHTGRKQYPIKFLLHPAHSIFYELLGL